MSIDIKGKRIIVTGGARGIGAAAVAALAREGAVVASFDVLDEAGERVAAAATKDGPGRVFYTHADVSRRDEIFGTTDAAVRQMGGWTRSSPSPASSCRLRSRRSPTPTGTAPSP